MTTHTVELDEKTYEFEWPSEKTLLDSMLDAGVPAPHSCTQGQCGACQCTVEGGASHMEDNAVLDEGDIADDQRLACQTKRDEDGPYDISYAF